VSPGRRRAALALLSAASFLAVVDTTVVSIALPTVAASLDMSAAAAAWILTAYSLAFGALLLPLGRVADRVGRRRLFCWGLVAFAIASLAAGLATSGAVLVAARFVQGAASAAFVPASLALVTAVHPDRHARSRALGV
jgi:MFS family permease